MDVTDPAEWIVKRGRAYQIRDPGHEHSLYGVINSWLLDLLRPEMGFHVKPQYRLKELAQWNQTHAKKDSSSTAVKNDDLYIPDVVVYWIPNPSDFLIDQIPVLVVDVKRSNDCTPSQWNNMTIQMRLYVKHLNDVRYGGTGDDRKYDALRHSVPGLLICNSNGITVEYTRHEVGEGTTAIEGMAGLQFLHRWQSIYDTASRGHQLVYSLQRQYFNQYSAVLPKPVVVESGLLDWVDHLISSRHGPNAVDLVRTESSLHGPINTRFVFKWPVSQQYIIRPQPILWTPVNDTPKPKVEKKGRDSQGNIVLAEPTRFPDFIVARVKGRPEDRRDDIVAVVEAKLKLTEQDKEDVTQQIHRCLEVIRLNYEESNKAIKSRVHGIVIMGMEAWHVGWKQEIVDGKKDWVVDGPDFTKPGVLLNTANTDAFWRQFDNPPE